MNLVDLQEAAGKQKVRNRSLFFCTELIYVFRAVEARPRGSSKSAEAASLSTTEQNEEYFVKQIEANSKCADDGVVCIVYPDRRHEPAGHDIMLSWAHLCVSKVSHQIVTTN